MSKVKIIRKEIMEKDIVFSLVLIEIQNAYIVLLSEGEERLGTLAISLPQKPRIIGPMLSSTLLGERNIILARLLAERLAKSLNRMVLVSVSLKSFDEKKAGRIFLELLKEKIKDKGDLRK